MKRNVYFVQANPVYGEMEKNVYIPYATGCIAAYAWADERIKANYKLGRLIYTRENIEAAIASLDDPYLVGFSCSVWNMEYNKAFAKELKILFPACIVLFGGHHVSRDDANLKNFRFIDILVHSGGEEAFKDILLYMLENKPLHNISNISFRNIEGDTFTSKMSNPLTKDYPSPYLEGVFDEILKDNIKFSVIIETNRGCPNSCAFCDWGDLKTKVRLFSIEKIEQELNWIAKHKIEYIYCGDANFGLFDRDEEITDIIIHLKKEGGYPQKFRVCFTKNRSEFVREISKKLNDNNIDKSQTLSFQSLSPLVLENIGRKNLDLEHFKHLMELYNHSGISAVSELILGLPGETYESFCEGICTLLDCGQHNSITVYPCELLPNSQMGAAEYISLHGIQSIKTPYNQIHCNIDESNNEIREYSEIIVATNTLTVEDWVRTVIFSCYIQALHNLGLTRVIAVYLKNENDISYLYFYSSLISFFENTPNTLINRVYKQIKALAEGVVNGQNAWVCKNDKFGNITWGFEEIIFLELASEIQVFFDEVIPFLDKYDIECEVFKDLLFYQRSIVKHLYEKKISIDLDYDFYNYFKKIYIGEYSTLLNVKNTLTIEDKTAVDTWEDYAKEVVWFGRREEATLYTGSKYDAVIKFYP